MHLDEFSFLKFHSAIQEQQKAVLNMNELREYRRTRVVFISATFFDWFQLFNLGCSFSQIKKGLISMEYNYLNGREVLL